MDSIKLHNQADRIEWVLRHHDLPARVTGGRVTDDSIQFNLDPGARSDRARVRRYRHELAVALGAPEARVTQQEGQVQVRIPREAPHEVRFLPLLEQLRRDPQLADALNVPGTALLGLASDGVPLMLRLLSPDVTHVLVCGMRGSGKSEAVKTILASLALTQRPRDIQFLAMDPRGGEAWRCLATTPHLLGRVAANPEECLMQLRWLENEMERREQEDVMRPHIVIAIDELGTLLKEAGREAQVHLTRLAQRGAGAGFSLLVCADKPAEAALSWGVKSRFPVRLIGKMARHESPIGALASTGSGKLEPGEFVLAAGGDHIRFRAAYLPMLELGAFQARLQQALATQKRGSGASRLVRRIATVKSLLS